MDTSEAEMDNKPKRPKLYQRQDSWAEFKGRAFRMAHTVALPPRHRRISTRSTTCDTLKTPTISVKSLPQIKRDFVVMPKRYQRSISAHNEPLPKRPCDPLPLIIHHERAKAKRFVPQKTLEEVEEPETPGSPSPSSSRSRFGSGDSSKSSYENLEKARTPSTPKISFAPASFAEDNFAENLFPIPRELGVLKKHGLVPSIEDQRKDESNSLHLQSRRLLIPPKEHEQPETKDDDEEESDDDLSYHDFYSCMPPPIFMLCITIAEIGFFVYHAKRLINDPRYGYINKFSPAPLESRLIYNPTRRYEVWRYFTYALVHSGYMHLINNIVVQLVLGIVLEMVHKWWRVLTIYFAGILAGSLATSITQPFNYLAGASAGVYALIAAHLSTVILNWSEMEYPWIRVLVFLAFVIHDGGTAVYYGYIVGERTNVGYAAHLGGAVAGLLVGIYVLKNLQWRKWEEILWWVCLVLCGLLLSFAVAWNIFRSDLYP